MDIDTHYTNLCLKCQNSFSEYSGWHDLKCKLYPTREDNFYDGKSKYDYEYCNCININNNCDKFKKIESAKKEKIQYPTLCKNCKNLIYVDYTSNIWHQHICKANPDIDGGGGHDYKHCRNINNGKCQQLEGKGLNFWGKLNDWIETF